jgi:YfiH family protein
VTSRYAPVPTLDAGLPVRAFFTTRDGGFSAAPFDSLNPAGHVGDDQAAVDANRARIDGLAHARVAYMSQVHGDVIARVHRADERPEADGLITDAPGLALAVLVADCVPVLLHDAATGAVAAVHAGRQGIAKGVVTRAVEALGALRPRGAGAITAAVGPAICGACYEVPDQMREEVAGHVPAAFATTSWGTPALDLRAAVEAQLRSAGVESVHRVGGCTREDSHLFSHRRDSVTGRFAGVIRCQIDPML